MRFLVFGADGWIGCMVVKLLETQGETVIKATCRADSEDEVDDLLITSRPDRVICLIGRTHGPGYSTIDYLEQRGKLVDNVRDNLLAPFVLAMVCLRHGLHLTYMGTGCIFDGYPEKGYTEDDEPDFFGSSYSVVKGFTDRMMHLFNHSVLNLRLRMPITSDLGPRNFITKIMTYERICSLDNSMSVLPELLPLLVDMSKKRVKGTVNFTNPGVVSHNEILQMVKDIYDPAFTWKNFSLEDQAKVLLSNRSNNRLDTTRLQELYPEVTPIKEAVRRVIETMRDKRDERLSK